MARELFCFLFFKNFQLVSIDLELNSTLGNQTYFNQKCGSCTQKSNVTWNLKIWVEIKKKNICDRKTLEKWWDQTLCIFKTLEFMALA